MRIGVNLIPLRPGQMGGAEGYVRDLLGELVRRNDHEYVLVTAADSHDTLPDDSGACRRILLAQGLGPSRRLPALAVRAARRLGPAIDRVQRWRARRRSDALQALIERERLDLWFCPFTSLEPRVCAVPAVITVFDLQHEFHPEFFDSGELRYRRRSYPESCAAADHVIAISAHVRATLIDRYDLAPERVSAIPLAASAGFAWRDASARVSDVRRRYGLPSRYAFYPANTWLHKNHARLIEALARYGRRHGDDLSLVLTGTAKEGHPALRSAVEEHGLAERVRFLGYVPSADLPAIYAGARCLVFPSLFEGFGMPLVEAMLVGCPVVASDVTSIPEVVGDAAVLFDPRDPDAIAGALARVVRDPAASAELSRRGRARAGRFSAEQTARLTRELFERVGRWRDRAGGHAPSRP